MPVWLLALLGAAVLVALAAYWLIVWTEGVYLGPRAVTALYDRVAGRYDQIKQFVDEDEDYFIGRPVARYLAGRQHEASGALWLLDVASGSGRLPLTVLRCSNGACRVIALDGSAAMLQQAQRKLSQHGWADVVFLACGASRLPFADGALSVVACLEALEFLPDPAAALGELLRVLEPGGLLVLSNRIGRQARLMPGRIFSGDALRARLRSLGAAGVEVMPWQVDYDLVFAFKQGAAPVHRADRWLDLLQCPRCAGHPAIIAGAGPERLACPNCEWRLTLDNGIWRSLRGDDVYAG